MRLVIVQDAGKHAANAEFRECLCLQRALIRQGHDAISCGVGHQHCGDLCDLMSWCDAIVILQNYDLDMLPDFSNVKPTTVFWSIDGHCNLDNHIKFCKQNRFDIVLNSCLQTVDDFKSHCCQSVWFPNAYPSDLITPYTNRNYDYAIGFCGTPGNPERQEYIKALGRAFGDQFRFDNFIIGGAMINAIKSYGIHFNRNLSHDINYRTFETMGTGRLLLTNETPGLRELFDLDRDLVLYDGIDDCIDKAKYFMDHTVEQRLRALGGRYCVRSRHTYDNRAERLIKLIG